MPSESKQSRRLEIKREEAQLLPREERGIVTDITG